MIKRLRRHTPGLCLLLAISVGGCSLVRHDRILYGEESERPLVMSQHVDAFFGTALINKTIGFPLEPFFETYYVFALEEEQTIILGPLGWFLAAFTPFFILGNLKKPVLPPVYADYEGDWDSYVAFVEGYCAEHEEAELPEEWAELVEHHRLSNPQNAYTRANATRR